MQIKLFLKKRHISNVSEKQFTVYAFRDKTLHFQRKLK